MKHPMERYFKAMIAGKKKMEPTSVEMKQLTDFCIELSKATGETVLVFMKVSYQENDNAEMMVHWLDTGEEIELMLEQKRLFGQAEAYAIAHKGKIVIAVNNFQ